MRQSCGLLLPVQQAAHRGERLAGEDRLQREAEVLRDPERQFQARVVVAAFQVADRLVVDPHGVGKPLPREAPLRPEYRDPVQDRWSHAPYCCITTTDWSRNKPNPDGARLPGRASIVPTRFPPNG